VKIQDLLRYSIWAAIAATADANRREYHMRTTWLPHFATNTLTLLLPDALRLLFPPGHKPANLAEQVLFDMVRDNPNYVVYVAPLAAGYLLSHPKFNIFKGDMAEIRVAGLGPDALPHGATGFALTALVTDSLEAACRVQSMKGPLVRLARRCNQNPALTSFGVLAALTFFWEYGEYRVHVHELELQGGDIARINMMWSADDTARDVAANLLGWALALLLRRIRNG
jgi:hypothetical protein